MIRRAMPPREYLVRRHFPEYGQIRQPPSLANPYSLSLQPDPARLTQAEAYMAELAALPDAEAERLAEEERAREEEAARHRTDGADERLGFGAGWARADFVHWSKATYWSLDEALVLTFGMEPARTNLRDILCCAKTSPAASRFARARDLVQRAKNWQQLTDPTSPGTFLAWAKRSRIEYPTALEAAVTANGHVIADWQSLCQQANDTATAWKTYAEENLVKTKLLIADLTEERDRLLRERETTSTQDKPLGTREKESLLKLVIGMAVGGYGYQVGASKNTAVPDIAGDLDGLGIGLDHVTIRKWLAAGGELIPHEARKTANEE